MPASQSDSGTLDRLLIAWVTAASRRPMLTVTAMLLITAALAVYAARTLTFNVDPNALFSSDLRFQQAALRFEEYFPVLTNSLLVVVDSPTPERTREAASRLLASLDSQREIFHRAFQPGEDRFFERHGLLYGSLDDLDAFADHMARMQPVLGELAKDLSLPTLAKVIRLGLEERNEADGFDAENWQVVLDHLREAADAVQAGDRREHSWEELLVSAAGIEPSTRSVIVADPIIDMEAVLGAKRAIEAVRDTASRLGLERELGARVRITGYPALNHEEMIGLASDTAVAGLLSFVFVVAVLLRAFRSLRLVIAAALTLLVGLVWAGALSAATVRELNPISITFGVLVIGLGIDFMIHLGMHFVDAAAREATVERALNRATGDTGSALVLCAVTTAVGFLAFAPTDYRGVSDLGLAASGGILAVLFLTLTLLPALMRLLLVPAAFKRIASQPPPSPLRVPQPSPALVSRVAIALAAGAVLLLPGIDLDTNVISFRNPETESVQTFKHLLESETTTPWFLDALAPSLERASALANDMRELPQVDEVVTLLDFVPEEQEEKIELLADVAMFLALPKQVTRREAPADEQLAAIRELHDFLASEPAEPDSPLGQSVRALRESLAPYVAGAGDASGTRAFADALLDPLPDQFARLRANLEVASITREELPLGLQERMLADDGSARIQIYPGEDLWDHTAMVDFVEAVRPIWSDITGLPVNLVESARATWSSLREALIWSGMAICVLLLLLWRRIGDTLITLAPLFLAVLLTLVSTVVLPITLNFADVIVLPLLLGIGVDSGIHLVHRAHQLGGDTKALLHSTTARAVAFSALTTVASFGTLSISGHRGVSSLGVLLMVGMLWTLAANLLLLPALLALRMRPRAAD